MYDYEKNTKLFAEVQERVRINRAIWNTKLVDQIFKRNPDELALYYSDTIERDCPTCKQPVGKPCSHTRYTPYASWREPFDYIFLMRPHLEREADDSPRRR